MLEHFRVVGEKMPDETKKKIDAYLANHNGEDFEVLIRKAPKVFRPVHCQKCGKVAEFVPSGVAECRATCLECRRA